MAIYIANLLLIWVYSLLYNYLLHKGYDKKKVRKALISLVSLQLILILSLRHYSVGVDIEGYLSFFRWATLGLTSEHRFEIGYKLYNKLVSFFTSNEQVFLAITAIVSLAPIGRFIYKHSKMPFLSFTLYIVFNYFSFIFSGLRQGIAYAIVFISYDYIRQRKLLKFLIAVVLAGLFHKSALIFLPAYFLYKIKISKIKLIRFIIVDIVLFIFRRQIMQFFIDNFYQDFYIIETSAYTWMTFCTTILLFGSFFYKKVASNSKGSEGLYMLLFVGVSLMMFATVGTNVMRMANYYYMFVIIFIPEVFSVLKKEKSLVLIGYALTIGLILIYFKFLNDNTHHIVPYKFFWQA